MIMVKKTNLYTGKAKYIKDFKSLKEAEDYIIKNKPLMTTYNFRRIIK